MEDQTQPVTLLRTAVLREAEHLISGPRAADYGSFGDQMCGIAEAFNGIMGENILDGEGVGIILMLLKLRRSTTASGLDSYTDLAGYAALQAEYFGTE